MTGDSRSLDAAARRAARTVFDRPLVLEAGAGTGKTATLVSRVVAWCVGPGWERAAARLGERAAAGRKPTAEEVAAECLGRVCAITFTEKAAAEMAERCALAFEGLARGEEVVGLPAADLAVAGEELAARATALATRIDRLEVTTIHGFCSRLLGAWPLEAGIRPGFEIDADGRRTLAIAEAIAASRAATLPGDPEAEDLVTLAAAGTGSRELADALAALLRAGVLPGEVETDPLPPARQETIAREVGTRAAALAAALDGTGWTGKVADRLGAALRALARAGGEGSLASVQRELAGEGGGKLLGDLDRTARPGKKPVTLLPPGEVAGFRRRCLGLRDLLREVRDLDPAFLGALHRVLARWLPPARERLLAEGAIGFQGLLVEARRLLASHRGVLHAVRASLDQLLVDEVQDTDPLQYEIVRLLALEDGPGLRPGLFVVGDPKQSIYGFRSADLAAYEEFLRRVLAAGGEVHSLVVNFRSVPPILDEVARSAGPLLVPEPGIQPPWEDLVPAGDAGPPPLPGDRAPVEVWASWDLPGPGTPGDDAGPGTGAERARELEAAAIARDLAGRMQDDPEFRPGRVAILLRATTTQGPYLDALRAAGIPCVVERERDWTRRRDVVDLAAVVRTVVDPADQVALVAALRAPFAGVPDAALPRLWRRGFPGVAASLGEDPAAEGTAAGLLRDVAAWLRGHEEDVPGLARIRGWEAAAIHFVEVLAELRESFREGRADAFVRRLADRLLPFAEAAARWQGETRVGYQQAFLRRLLERLRGLAGSPQQVLRALRETTAGLLEIEASAAVDEAEDAVRVLTIHKAKGLTFDEVYVVDLHHRIQGRGNGDGPRIVRDGGKVLVAVGGRALPGDARRRELAERKGSAEETRMFYVAATRPRRRLVLCGCWPAEGKERDDTVVGRLASVRPAPFAAMLAAGESERTGEDGVRYRILGGVATGEEGSREDIDACRPLPPVREILAEARGRRKEAAARAAVALLRSPSGAAEEGEGDEEEGDGPPPFPADPRERDVLLAAGTVVHRLMELFVPGSDPAASWEGLLVARLPGLLVAAAGEEIREDVAEEVRAVLDGFPGSFPFRRFVDIFPGILGREVPLALEADPEAEGAFAWSGTIDLLYEDPETGDVVVADHKTDRAATPADRARLARHYAPQLAVYARAVARALGLPRSPRRELWFLREGTIEPVPGE